MKTYPSISKQIETGTPVFIFDKLDGSNIRAEWSKKKGFYKFGTRKRLLDPNETPLGYATKLIEEKYSDKLSYAFKRERIEKAVCFFEFFGKNSFAGNHDENDIFDLTLIDISLYKKGIIPPKDFIDWADRYYLQIPRILGYENITENLIEKIKNNTLDNMSFEGVVCKHKKKKEVKMFKIKSNAWLEKLKNYCGEDTTLFEELA